MKFNTEEEIDIWYEEEKDRLMKIYLDELEGKKPIDAAEKKYSDALKKLIVSYKDFKEKIIDPKKK